MGTLQFSIDCGGDGFSGISANFYPYLHSWMVRTMLENGYKEDAASVDKVTMVQQFLSVAENTVVVNYPAAPKQYLADLYTDFPISTVCRSNNFEFDEQQLLRLHDLAGLAKSIAV